MSSDRSAQSLLNESLQTGCETKKNSIAFYSLLIHKSFWVRPFCVTAAKLTQCVQVNIIRQVMMLRSWNAPVGIWSHVEDRIARTHQVTEKRFGSMVSNWLNITTVFAGAQSYPWWQDTHDSTPKPLIFAWIVFFHFTNKRCLKYKLKIAGFWGGIWHAIISWTTENSVEWNAMTSLCFLWSDLIYMRRV